MVTVISQAMGTSVTHSQRTRPILIKIVVATTSATAASKHGEHEERLEHDCEVIPDAEQALAADGVGKNLRHAHGERRCAARTIEQCFLADQARKIGHGV